MKGDILAGGGHTATFPAAPKITQEAWDKIWEQDEIDKIEVYRSDDGGKTFKQVTGKTDGK